MSEPRQAYPHAARPRARAWRRPFRHRTFLAAAADRGRQHSADHRGDRDLHHAARPQPGGRRADPRLAGWSPSSCCCSSISITIHMRIGMQVVIEDYVHDELAKFVMVMANTFFCHRDRAGLDLRYSQAFLRIVIMATNGANGGSAAPAINGRAYPIEDHAYDVVIVGAGGAGLRAVVGCSEAGLAHRLHHQGLPDALAHGGGAGRHCGCARQHGRGRLALAHVRHGQGLRLARRPGRDRISVPQRAGGGLRARALGPAVLAARGRQDLSAAVRRHDHPLRQRHRATHLRRRRPYRPCHAAHDVRPGAAPFGRVFHRIFRHRPDHGRGRPLPRRGRAQSRRRHDPSL